MPSKKKTKGQELKEKLTFEFPLVAKAAPERVDAAMEFCEGYKSFLDAAKTERECVCEAVSQLHEAGYVPFDPAAVHKKGDKIYYNNRDKAVIAVTFGKKPLTEGLRLNMAHIDCPRLDLKPYPVYEKNDIAYFKTHYYGGIRKYQWATIPLSLHGVIYKKNGECVNIRIGDESGDPVFYITDLLPHLAQKQNARKLAEGLRGEELNILIGSLPFPEKDIKEPVKLAVLAVLNEKYGITEADFLRAELELVSAQKARDVGFDRSMIAAVGHDDRVCAYPALRAEIDTKKPTYTTVTVLTDKEEIGSVGPTGLNSDYVLHFLEYLAENAGVNYKDMVRNALCLSSDVSAAYDPTFSDVFDPLNSCYLGKGCVLTKYTGSRGKSGSSDANAEFVAKVRKVMDDNDVAFQTCELGKVDVGGGGTIAYILANMNMDVLDAGICVQNMHAPFEVVGKLDCYMTYKGILAAYRD